MRTFIRCWLFTFIVFLIAASSRLTAQDITQTVRGVVTDSDTQRPLSGASVYIKDISPTIGTTTDDAGRFLLEGIPVGRYVLKVSSVGYETHTIPDLLVRSGKESVLAISLTQSVQNLDEVVVAEAPENVESIAPISSHTFSVEETRRYAATFFDPARLVTSFPGVIGTNDQSNQISVRGNSPNSLLWRLEGIDIVNPNHLSNAGTFGDRRVQSGGSQSILSTQVLDDSRFFSGAFPAQYGNAIGGVMDMQLRKGNSQRQEYTAQLGLIGLEFAAEGPFREDYQGSYLANYRYSTVGILTNLLGLDFGGERIAFQDLSFNLSFPTKKAGDFTLFGVGGTGSNVFEALRDSAEWEEQEDRYDVTFTNDMAVVGLTHTLPIGEQSLLKSVIATSSLRSERFSNRIDDTYEAIRTSEDKYQENRLSITSSITRKFTGNHTLQGGFYFDNLYYQLSSSEADSDATGSLSSIVSGEGGGLLLRPYLDSRLTLASRWTLNAGLHFTYFTFNGSHSLEPRLSLRWNVVEDQSHQQFFTASFGLHSQLQLPGVYFFSETLANGTVANPNQDLGLTKSEQYTIGYDYMFSESFRLHTEAYYQRLFNVPISSSPGSTFSALNLLDGFVREALVSEGTGQNYGLETTVEKSLSDSYYFLISGSLYESKYTGADGVERDTRFNGNYALSFTGGKEYAWNKKDKQRVIGINLRSTYIGGLRVSPINEPQSRTTQNTVFVDDQAFTEKLPDYFKIDVRLSLRKDTPRYSSVWSLDLQNATNRQNVAYQYYDTLQGEIITKYQLGLIPILTYRVEF